MLASVEKTRKTKEKTYLALDCPRSRPEDLGPRADPDRPSRATVRATILRTGPQIRGPRASLRWRVGPGRARAMARTYASRFKDFQNL